MIGRTHAGAAYRCDCLNKIGVVTKILIVGVYAAVYGLHYRGGVATSDCAILLLGKSRLGWTMINGF